MAAIADKARFYLERAVPQLREFEEKEIFTKDEIRTLVTKRSDFEHLVLGPKARVEDFLAYAAWEQQLDALRAARCKRLRIRSTSAHAAQARTFAIFERAVTRHPGHLGLWFAYLDFAAKVKASKRWRKVVTRALRMHPNQPSLWVLAGTKAARDGDMDGARGYFMRGCRFCTAGVEVWAEYARCEMEWLARLEAKKAKGGKSAAGAPAQVKISNTVDEDGNMLFDEDSEDELDEDDIMVPDADAQFRKEKPKEVFDAEVVQKLESSPAMDGAIPMAVFDIARKQAFFGAPAAEAFFNVFAAFPKVPCHGKLVQHVLDIMTAEYPTHPATCSCYVRQALVGVEYNTPEFPKALREALARLRSMLESTKDRAALGQKTLAWIEPLLALEDLDTGIRTVLEHTKRKLES
ncbi:U3 small nucleolar RNA-associated protein 6-domain-containing protein [Coniochaeta sp. 2T2.1]|nr:U3 small nucleolar RNA-associated protein 6-domain-containing protein [Coniochaeta sp. 2T2.1]